MQLPPFERSGISKKDHSNYLQTLLRPAAFKGNPTILRFLLSNRRINLQLLLTTFLDNNSRYCNINFMDPQRCFVLLSCYFCLHFKCQECHDIWNVYYGVVFRGCQNKVTNFLNYIRCYSRQGCFLDL